jgi:hypothetical protein
VNHDTGLDGLVVLRAHLTKRIDRLLELARQWVQQTPLPPQEASTLAHLVLLRMNALAGALLTETPLRKAVLDRPMLAERWPLEVHDAPAGSDEQKALDFLAIVETSHTGPWEWPGNVAPAALAAKLRETGDPDAAIVAGNVLKGIRYTGENRERRIEGLSPQFKDDSPDTQPPPSPEVLRAHQRWPVMPCAVLLSIAIDVRAEIAAFRGTPIPATKPARVAIAAVSRGPGGPWSNLHHVRREPAGEPALSLELVWDGKPNAYQLSLTFPTNFEAQLVGGILQELQADGLRDYLVLHRMAAEQGRTGSIRWTWREHRERTAYDSRIRAHNATDAEVRHAVTTRLFRLKGAELRETARQGNRVAWRRIGPFGLIDIPAAISSDDDLDLAPLQLNPELYAGAATGTDKPHFTLLPDDAFSLAGDRFRLAALLVLAMRDARDEGGTVRLTAAKLWEHMDLRGGNAKGIPRHRWPRLDATLVAALDALVAAKVIGAWSREVDGPPDPRAVYRIDPRTEWRDLVVHGLPPSFPPSLASTPRTGAELRAWREARRLSQAAAAQILKVGIATVKRAESDPAASLGPALLRALAEAPDPGSPKS